MCKNNSQWEWCFTETEIYVFAGLTAESRAMGIWQARTSPHLP